MFAVNWITSGLILSLLATTSILSAERGGGYRGGGDGYHGQGQGYAGRGSYYERDGRYYNYDQGYNGQDFNSGTGVYPYIDDQFGNPNYGDDEGDAQADQIFDSYDSRNR